MAPARLRGGRRMRHGRRRVPRRRLEHLRAGARLGDAPQPALHPRPEPDDGRGDGRPAQRGPSASCLRSGPYGRHRRPTRLHHRCPPPLLGPRPQLPPVAPRRPAGRGEARRLPGNPEELPPRRLPAGLGGTPGRRVRVRGGGVGPVRSGRRDGVGGAGRGGVRISHRHRRASLARAGGCRRGPGRPGGFRPGAGGCGRSPRWPRTRTRWSPTRRAR